MVTSPLEVASLLLIISVTLLFLGNMDYLRHSFGFLLFSLCAILYSILVQSTWFFQLLGGIKAQMTYIKLMLIGLLIMLSLKYNPKGLLPEVPYRPEHPKEVAKDE